MNPKRYIDKMSKWLALAVLMLLFFAMGIMPFTNSGSAFAASDAAAYTVDFEYEGQTLSIEGGSEILASELFERLCIDGDVSAADHVEFTDPQLIRVERTGDDWKLTSLKPFRTEERLTVTMADKVIEIKVTDADNNNTFLLHREEYSNEYFRTRVYTSRPGGARSQTSTAGTVVNSDGTYGWQDFDTLLNKYYSNYSYTGSNKRYSVSSAQDPTTRSALCAVGFQEGWLVTAHAACGLYPQADWLGRNGNGSAIDYDLDIELNDNSIPVRIYVDGTLQEDTIFLSDVAGDHSAEEIANSLGYEDYAVESSKVNGTDVNKVTAVEQTGQSLAGNRLQRNRTAITVIGVSYSFDPFDYTYPKAYGWTYNNGTAVGDSPYVINLETPIARVSNDGGNTWTYHAHLIDSGTQGGGTVYKGAFNQANSLSGDVVVEMLYDSHDRYTLNSGFTFNNSSINKLTIKGTDNKSTLVKDQTTSPMITTSGIDKVQLDKVIFDGDGKITTDNNGGAVRTNAQELTVSDCTFDGCQAGRQGGGIYHSNTDGTVSITDSEFTGCRANGPDDAKGGGGGGLFTDAQTLTVTDSTFEGCSTAVRQGAGLFHKRVNGAAASETTIRGSRFENCTAIWSGGGVETDAWNTTIEDTDFIGCKASKGGAINVWADGVNETQQDTTLSVTDCTFDTCSGTDNGGAIRSTALHTIITDSSFNTCTTSANGGALACTSKYTETVITDCSFTDCHADNGNGGACFTNGTTGTASTTISETSPGKTVMENCSAGKGGTVYSGKLTVSGGTIRGCSATTKGGAISGTQQITMTGGTVTGNSTGGNSSAAVDADTKTPGLIFSGNVIVANNTGSGGEARDVYLGVDTDRHILIDGSGLGESASIGIYVADTDSAFVKHGEPGLMFAYTTLNTTSVANLHKLFSDRLDNGPMYGAPAVPGQTNYQKRVRWITPLCKLTDSDGKLLYKDAGHTDPAIYSTLSEAFADCKITLYKETGDPYSYDPANDINVEMLKNYEQPQTDQVTSDANRVITLTTANTDAADNPGVGDVYVYSRGTDTTMGPERATITRGWSDNADSGAAAMFHLNNSGLTLITEDIILDGNGGTNKGRAIYVKNGSLSANGNTTFQNFSMNNADGGAVYADNAFTYTVSDTGNVLFDNCTARNGGAIGTKNSLTVTNDDGGTLRFNACSATGSGSNGLGGGIYGNGALTITSAGTDKTSFTSCVAIYGGGIYQSGTGDLTLTNVTFGESGEAEEGCFAEMGGGSVYSYGKNTTITDCDFYYSKAGSGLNNNNTHGGAVLHDGPDAEHQILGCVFDHCSANTMSKDKGHGNGGAVYISENGIKLTIDRSESRRSSFTNCSAYRYGGAVIMEKNGDCTLGISNSDFADCYTTFRDGGAVYTDSNVTSFANCTFKRCHSDSTSGDYDGGGAIYANGDTGNLANVRITISDCKFEDCHVMKNGGAMHFYSTGTNATLNNVQIKGHVSLDADTPNAELGSGIYSRGNVTIKDSEITGCSASVENGGAVNLYSGKTVYFEGDTVIRNNTNTSHDTGNEHNVILDQNRNLEIQTTSTGLGENADIGIYVTGATSMTNPFKDHGSFKDDFGTYASGGSTANFDKFINDRVKDANGDKLRGELCPEQGHASQRLIRWIGEEPVAPTNVEFKVLPFLLILLAGFGLLAILRIRKGRSVE